MRTADICPTCAVYYNALCVLYNGDYLGELDLEPLDSLEVALEKIAAALNAFSGTTDPTSPLIPNFLGQHYINTNSLELWVGLSTTLPIWGLVGVITTTTTTSTTTSTTTTAP